MSSDDTRTPVPTDNEDSGPSKRLIGSTLIVVAIVALGLVLSLTNLLGGSDGPKPAAQPSAPSVSSPASTSPAVAGEASVCGLTAIQTSGTLATAPAATWSLVGKIAAPAIKGQGPGKIDTDGYRGCYARTPTGALLAAANYSAMGSYSPLTHKLYQKALVDGPGRDAVLSQPTEEDEPSTSSVQVGGFRILSYDGSQTDVDLLFKTSQGAIASVVNHLEWADGDWKLELPDDGSDLPLTQLPSTSGYILWSGA